MLKTEKKNAFLDQYLRIFFYLFQRKNIGEKICRFVFEKFVKTCRELNNRHDDKSSSTRALFSILGINWEWISHGFNWASYPIFSIQRAFGTYILGKPYKSFTGPRGSGRGGGCTVC